MEIKDLAEEARKLKEMAESFAKELTGKRTQEGYLEIITTKVPDLLSKIVKGLEDLAEKISKLEDTPVENKTSFVMIMTEEELHQYMKRKLPQWIKEVRELSEGDEE